MVAVADRPLCAVSGTWKWGLDALGNWSGYNYAAGDGSTWDLAQERTHDAGNEITGFSGGGWAATAFDDAGNMTAGPIPGAEATQLKFVYDAWNRLVKVGA